MKRKIVVVDCEKITPLIKRNEWNNSSFSRKVGKYSSWYGEVLRGNNLPSPEEAARMCVLLQTTPEEILTNPADIELVNSLIEEERGKNIEKAPADKSGSQSEEEFMMLFQQLSPEEQANEIAYLRERIAREAAKGK